VTYPYYYSYWSFA